MTYNKAVEIFIRDVKLRNRAEATVTYYQNELKGFEKVLKEMDVPLLPSEVTPFIIEEFCFYMLEEKGAKAGAVNTRLRAVRALFNFLFKKRLIPENPVSDLSLLKDVKGDIIPFTKDHILRLFKQADRRTFTGLRNFVIMMIMVNTGIRLSELANINMVDVLWDDKSIVVRHSKNGMVRRVPISKETSKSLEEYVKHRGQLIGNNALFVTVDDKRISTRQIQNFINDYGKAASINDVRCSPHTFRHTFDKMALQGGSNMFELQHILGHNSLEMVRVYVHLFSNEVGRSHVGFSPTNQLK